MFNFMFGVFVGIVVASVGFGNLAPILDNGVDHIKQGAQEYVNDR